MHRSPFDALPANHLILTEKAHAQALRRIAGTQVIDVPVDLDLRREASALNERREALQIWHMPPGMRVLMREAAVRWFDEPGLCREAR